MVSWVPIQYREFWDVPRIFIASFQGKTFLFDCRFDEATEDFPDCYEVYLIRKPDPEALAGSWDGLRLQSEGLIATVPVEEVLFDPSKRHEIDVALLEKLTTPASRT